MEKDSILKNIKIYIDNVLRNNRSKSNSSPLLADGINIYTLECAKWNIDESRCAVISDFVATQNFLRTLVSYSKITNDNTYAKEAKKIAAYFLDHYVDESGLFYWGGHYFIDLDTLEPIGPSGKNEVHELKSAYPFYEFLYEVNPVKTKRFLAQVWSAHVNDWSKLDMNRHGSYQKKFDSHIIKEPANEIDAVDPKLLPNLPETKGLTFLNIATDLMYAAYSLSAFTGNKNAFEWGHYLARQYELAKNPKTNLPVYQYSKPLKTEDTDDDNETFSHFGDRIQRQMKEFGSIALEANRLFDPKSTMGKSLSMQAYIADKFKDEELGEWIIRRVKNYYQYAYNEASHSFKPMFNDGTDLTGYKLLRNGYVGKRGYEFKQTPFDSEMANGLIDAYQIRKDKEIWHLLQKTLMRSGFGDIGIDGKSINLNYNQSLDDEQWILLFIKLFKLEKNEDYLIMCNRLIENVFKNKFVNGYFIDNKDYLFSKINNGYALIMIDYLACLDSIYDVPQFLSRGGFIHGEYYLDEKLIDVKDHSIIYKRKKC